jgi:hypothetical protein
MESAIQNLVNMRDTNSLYEIMTESDDWMLCLDAAEGLVTLGDERGLQFLQDATESEDDDIRTVAQEILDSPSIQRMQDEIKVRERQERQALMETAKKRLAVGKKVYRYKTVYLPSSAFTFDDPTADDEMDIEALNDFGLAGWQVAAYLAHRDTTPGVFANGKLSGGFFLLQKEFTTNNADELDE